MTMQFLSLPICSHFSLCPSMHKTSCSMQANEPCICIARRIHVCHSEPGNDFHSFKLKTFRATVRAGYWYNWTLFLSYSKGGIHQKYSVRKVVIRMITESKTLLHEIIAETVAAVIKLSRGRLYQSFSWLITGMDLLFLYQNTFLEHLFHLHGKGQTDRWMND